ncbi:MAG: response regulator [Kofleriaceae bacterium]
MTTRGELSGARSTTPVRDLVGAQVLVVDGDVRIHAGITELLTAASLHVTCVVDPEQGQVELGRHFYSVILVDLDTPTPGAGLEFIRTVRSTSPTSMVIGLTPRRSFDDAVAAIRAGAIDLILKTPESVAYLKDRVLDAASRSVGRRQVDAVLLDVRSVHEEFLQRFMEAERRAQDAADRVAGRDPGRSMDLEAFAVLVVDEVDSLVDELGQAAPAARALGDDKKAENALRRALEKEPAHEATLQALVELGGQRGDWKMVVDAKRVQTERADDAIRGKLFDEIGDLLRGKLKDPAGAIGAYLEAHRLQPSSHALLHKLLDAYSEQKQWRRAVEILDQLAGLETSPGRRAKYHYAAAVIARDELADTEVAVERFNLALDDAPTTPKAFEAVDKLLTDAHDWKNLARAVRRHLKRLGEDAEPEQLLALWTRLGDLYLDHLGNNEAAIEAYELAAQLDPGNHSRHEQLADLYLEAGEARRGDAIAELQALLAFVPDRVEVYKALSNLYREENELDKAWCLAQALVFLGAASADEKALYQKYRPAQFIPATRRLTEELWGKAIIHPREDRAVGAIFASTLGAVAGASAQPPTAFGLDAKARVDLEHDTRLPARVTKYAAGVLALDAPLVWFDGGDGIRVANTVDNGKLAPSLLCGSGARADERELAFEIGKHLAYLRPERFVTYALASGPKVESAFAAALIAAGTPGPGDAPEDARKLAVTMQKTVPGPLLEQVAVLAGKLGPRLGNGLVASWRSATDFTANRVGLILANDLETAARMVATETSTTSVAPVKERLAELLAFAASESYFQVRRHLGLTVRAEASA